MMRRRLWLGTLVPAALLGAATVWAAAAGLTLARARVAVADGALRVEAISRERCAVTANLLVAAEVAGCDPTVSSAVAAALAVAGSTESLHGDAHGRGPAEACRDAHARLSAALERLDAEARRLPAGRRQAIEDLVPALAQVSSRLGEALAGLDAALRRYEVAAAQWPGPLLARLVLGEPAATRVASGR